MGREQKKMPSTTGTTFTATIRGQQVDLPLEAQFEPKSNGLSASGPRQAGLFSVKVNRLIALILKRQAEDITHLLMSSPNETVANSTIPLSPTEQDYFLQLKKQYNHQDIAQNPILLALALLNDAPTNPTTKQSAAEVVTLLLENFQRLQQYSAQANLELPSKKEETRNFAKNLSENAQSVLEACLSTETGSSEGASNNTPQAGS